MKVLFVASEAAPFAKTGGLGDVIGSLPRALHKQGIDVRVFVPKYGSIASTWKERMQLRTTFYVHVGYRYQYCGIEELVHDGVTYYFVDNEYYFDRPSPYGYYDEAERFTYFNRAVLSALQELDFQADIVHCHDWQTALIPLFLQAHYRENPFYAQMRTVFTIHNMKYQGIFPMEILHDLLHLDTSYFTVDGIEFYGQVSFMKAGLNYADILTTVSPTYAREVQAAYYGEQLEGLLQKRNDVLYGILNGIDYGEYDPKTDPHLFTNYVYSQKKKQENKVHLQQLFGLPQLADVPMFAIVSRLVEQKGMDLIQRIIHDLLQLNIQLVVLGTGEKQYEDFFRTMHWFHAEKVSVHITFDEGLARKIYAASDFFLMPSRFEPCGIGQLIALRYGAAPIVRETGGLKDSIQAYNEHTKAGNGFSFTNYNAHDLLYTIKQALHLYADAQHWSALCRNMNQANYSWEASAKKYVELYAMLLAIDDVVKE